MPKKALPIKPLTDEQRKMCEENRPLAIKIASDFIRKNELPRHIMPDYIFSGAYLGLINAIQGYNSSKGVRFSTYATSAIYTGIYGEFTEADCLKWNHRKQIKEGIIPNITHFDISDFKDIKIKQSKEPSILTKAYLEYLLKDLNPHQQKVVMLRATEEKTFKAISKIVGGSPQAAHTCFKNAMIQIKRKQKFSKVSKQSLLSSF